MDLLRLLFLSDDDLLYEPTPAEAFHGMQVVNPMPMTVMVMLSATISCVSEVSATLTASVAPAS